MTTATKTCKAFQLTDFAVKAIEECQREIRAPQGHEVLIAVKAASLNFRDLMVARGIYSKAIKLPVVPLSDGAGEVIAVGDKVSRFQVGDRVSANFMPEWISGPVNAETSKTSLGAFVDGVLQEQKIFNEDALVHIPAHLSYEEAATLPCAALTAWQALIVKGQLKPGKTVLVLGTGGVSIFALQIARFCGAEVIATTSSDKKAAQLKELGAVHVINYKTTPNWDDEVLAFTKGRGVDHVIEVGGAGTLDRSLKAVSTGGHVSLIGVLAAGGQFNPIPILMKAIDVRGVFVGSRTMYEDMNRAISLHKLKPVIDRVFPASEIVGALEYLASGQHFGKIVIKL